MKVNGLTFYRMVLSAANALDNNKVLINNMNIFPVPDGDTGVNMSLSMSMVKDIKEEEVTTLAECSKRVAGLILRSARGNSGAILSLFFRGVAKSFENVSEAGAKDLANAFEEGTKEAYKAVMNPTEGTILTVMRRCSEQALEAANSRFSDDVLGFFAYLVTIAEAELARTPELLPVLKEAKVVDAGGYGFVTILTGMLSLLNGKPVEAENPTSNDEAPSEADFSMFDTEDVKFAYCTECIVEKSSEYYGEGKAASFYNYIAPLGDSAVFIDDEEIIKLHIHTNNPGLVLEKAIEYGMLSKVKIENMKIQHSAKVVEETELKKEKTVATPVKEYGSVAVCMGEGITSTFKDLGVDNVIYGGQTMNPSTQDILDAINKTPARNVFLLPNNKNVILVSEQAAALVEDKNVILIPTRNVPQGVSALLTFDEGLSPEENREAMKSAADGVVCITTTHAVRDSVIEGLEIKNGQAMGLVNGKIKSVGETPEECVTKLTDVMKDVSFVTIFYGSSVTEDDANKIYTVLNGLLSDDSEIVLINGGQPVYDYIISLE